MHCPVCAAVDTSVVDSRISSDGSQVRRRRECDECRARFTTYEQADMAMPRIVKRNGERSAYDESKLRAGMLRALEKRPVSAEAIDSSLQRITQRLRTDVEREVESRVLGEWVMDELRQLDAVAYVRFASVYRSFQDVSAFHDEIERLHQHLSNEKKEKINDS